MKKILALLLLTLTLSSCEKDDICTDETTPRLIIEFYDSANPTALKNVIDLKVKADGASDYVVFNADLEVTNPLRYLFNGSKLELPLRIAETSTTYHLILNSTDTVNINEDILQLNYTPKNVYVSRACGYKTIFDLTNPNGAVISDVTPADDLWIQPLNINIITTNIETENETHIKIYF